MKMKEKNPILKKKTNEEKFLKIIDELKDKIIVVEGKNDKKALKALDLNNIIAINGKPLFEIANEISKRAEKTKNDIVILTDFDKTGKDINIKLKNILKIYKKQPNSRLRGMIMNLGRNKIEDMNKIDLVTFNKEVDIYGEISADINKIRDKSPDRGKRCNRKARCDRSSIRSN